MQNTKVPTPKQFKVTVIIVAYDRDAELKRLLDAVFSQSMPPEQIELSVVDNEGLCIKTKEFYSHKVSSWISTKENIGASAGRNLGATIATTPYLIFLDDDGIPHTDFLQVMKNAFDEDRNLIAARGKIRALSHPILTSAASHYHRGPKTCLSMLDIEGATCIRRDAYETVNGYDDRIFGNEGKELGHRLLQAFPSGKILYIPGAVLYHDLFKGLGHLLSKAKRMAYAESHAHPAAKKLKESSSINKILLLPDGRLKWERMTGKLVLKVYKLAVSYYRKRM
jgi:GT2 family glycosyltransferase